MNDQVYIFAGIGEANINLNSIEKIATAYLVSNGTELWKEIQVPRNILNPCHWSAVTPLNRTEICIMGGRDNNNWFGDVVVFDTKIEQCHKVRFSGDPLKF